MRNYSTSANGLRWFTVVATKQVLSDSMEYEASVDIRIMALNATDAMKKVRHEFRFWHLRVIP